jgi:hypothetical protein
VKDDPQARNILLGVGRRQRNGKIEKKNAKCGVYKGTENRLFAQEKSKGAEPS